MDATLGAFSNVFEYCKALKRSLVSITFMCVSPGLVTLKASKIAAMCALKLIALIFFDDVFLAINVRAPDCVWVFVYLAR
jgi:hypothetical protein